ncbi:MAG TPA: rubrerythrin family protein [Archaeoglobus veneficus]|nr:rubrerythrin family protein [Archaeoglobus veneficus]
MEVEEILNRALELEEMAIQEYLKMKKDADHETVDLLDFLIEQEKEHIKMINERLKAIKLLKK